MKKIWIAATSLIVTVSILALAPGRRTPVTRPWSTPAQPAITAPNISVKIPQGHLKYDQVVAQLRRWEQEAPNLVSVQTYGKTSKGRDICLLNICPKIKLGLGPSEHTIDLSSNSGSSRPKVLLTSAIHGNEWGVNAVMMGFVGTLLNDYGKDPRVTKLLDSRDIYFVPVVSPDSYEADSRQVDGVDPNRSFPVPGKSAANSPAPVKALMSLHEKHRFDAAMSGHNFGRVLLYPWGYNPRPAPDAAKYQGLLGRMGQLCGYQPKTIRNAATPPMHGFEADWFYANGAFAIVGEFGTEFKPSQAAVEAEVAKIYTALLLFVEEAPVILRK